MPTPVNFSLLPPQYFKPLVFRNFSTVGTVIFAKQGGSSTADGKTEANAVHMQRALDLVPAGGTVVIISPIIRTTVTLFVKRQCYIQPKTGIGKVKIKGSIQLPANVWTPTEANPGVYQTPWTVAFNNPFLDDNYVTTSTAYLKNVQGVYSNEEPLQQKGSIATLDEKSFYHDPVAGLLYIKQEPDVVNLEGSTSEQVLNISLGAAAGTVVRNLILTQAKVGAFSAVPMRWEDCQFDKNALVGYNGNTHPGITEAFQCTFNNNGFKGYGGRRCLITKSEIAFNNFKGYRIAWDASGAKVITDPETQAYDPGISKTEFAGNYVHDNNSNGLWFDVHITGGLARWNVVTDNVGIGIFYEISMHGRLTGNIALNNGTDIQVSNSHSTWVYNNTISPNKANAIVITSTNRSSADLTAEQVTYLNGWVNYVPFGHRCFNNLVVHTPLANRIAINYIPHSATVANIEGMFAETGTGNNFSITYPNIPEGVMYRVRKPTGNIKDFPEANSFRLDHPTLEPGSFRKMMAPGDNVFIGDSFNINPLTNLTGRGRILNTEFAAFLGATADSVISPGAMYTIPPTEAVTTPTDPGRVIGLKTNALLGRNLFNELRTLIINKLGTELGQYKRSDGSLVPAISIVPPEVPNNWDVVGGCEVVIYSGIQEPMPMLNRWVSGYSNLNLVVAQHDKTKNLLEVARLLVPLLSATYGRVTSTTTMPDALGQLEQLNINLRINTHQKV
jgi:hypothetical protein